MCLKPLGKNGAGAPDMKHLCLAFAMWMVFSRKQAEDGVVRQFVLRMPLGFNLMPVALTRQSAD